MYISDIGPILTAAKQADDAILLEGLHGIGKSEIVKQYCDENNYHYTPLFLSLMEEGDLLGIPHIENGVTTWAEPLWIHEMKEASKQGKHCVLLLDELNRASTSILNAAFELVLTKKIHSHLLPEFDGMKTQIIACINPASGDYQVQELDSALLDRFLRLEVEVSVSGWLDWARNNKVNKIVREFITNNPTKLYFIPEENSLGSTPRSFTKLAKFMDNVNNIPEEVLFDIIRGKIGEAVGSQFFVFYNNYEDNINIGDVKKFIDKKWVKINKLEEEDTNKLILVGDELKKFTESMEPVVMLEYLNDIYSDSIKSFDGPNQSYNNYIYLYAFLYSFNVEVLASFILSKKENDKSNFYTMMKLDPGRQLARKIKNNIVNDVSNG